MAECETRPLGTGLGPERRLAVADRPSVRELLPELLLAPAHLAPARVDGGPEPLPHTHRGRPGRAAHLGHHRVGLQPGRRLGHRATDLALHPQRRARPERHACGEPERAPGHVSGSRSATAARTGRSGSHRRAGADRSQPPHGPRGPSPPDWRTPGRRDVRPSRRSHGPTRSSRARLRRAPSRRGLVDHSMRVGNERHRLGAQLLGDDRQAARLPPQRPDRRPQPCDRAAHPARPPPAR